MERSNSRSDYVKEKSIFLRKKIYEIRAVIVEMDKEKEERKTQKRRGGGGRGKRAKWTRSSAAASSLRWKVKPSKSS